ncbi:MAG: family transporter, partial [Bryobacterales bacterium]|nr:family transporter [Bryobacterales bacterium]
VPQVPTKIINVGTSLIAITSSVALLYFGRDFFVALILAAMFAFLLDPAVVFVMKLRVPRGLATPIVIGVAFAALYSVALLAWTQVAILSEDLPTYTSRLNELLEKTNTELDGFEQRTIESLVPKSLRQQQVEIQQKPQEAMRARRRKAGLSAPTLNPLPPVIQQVRLVPEPRPVITTLYGYVSQYLHVLVMVSFVPFLVYFMLSWRDRIGESFLRLFRGEQQTVVGRAWVGIGNSTRAYVLGNFLLWIFLSSASSVVFFLLGVPYWGLVGTASGFLSLLPYIGLPLSVVPPLLAAIAVPNKFKTVLLVTAFAAAMHVFAMNFLYAKIIGRRVRLNPLTVTVALMFWGAVWGGAGLILAVPITAAIKAVCDNVDSLKGYGELLGD